jgi:hypothetical protein
VNLLGYTIYTINIDDTTLETAVQEKVEERPIWQKATSFLTALAICAGVAVIEAGCGGGDGTEPNDKPDSGQVGGSGGDYDGGAGVGGYAGGTGGSGGDDPDAGGTSGDGGEANPIGEIDTTTVSVEDGATVGPEDNPLEFGLETPDYDGELPGGFDVTSTATFDNGTPDDPSDDTTVTVIDETAVDPNTYVSGTIDLSDAQDGEGITIDTVVSDGENSRRVSVNIVYEAPDGPRILDDWHLDLHNYNVAFNMVFNVENFGDKMEYSIVSFGDQSQWFSDYYDSYDVTKRGPPDFPRGEIMIKGPCPTWADFEFVLSACDLDTGLCGEKTIYGSMDRYNTILVAQDASNTCNVEITNTVADYLGKSDSSAGYDGFSGYVSTDNVDGSAVRNSEVNTTTQSELLPEVSDRITNMSAEMEEGIRRISSQDPGSSDSWDCVETVASEGGATMYQIQVKEPGT